MSVALVVDTLTRGDARTLTEEVKRDAAVLRAKLLRLYEGRAHEALGYSSWATTTQPSSARQPLAVISSSTRRAYRSRFNSC